jgi:phenylacetate-coenzyme A ligase PaaK-like adenylate-forming protein
MQPVEKVKEMQLRKFKEVFEYARANNPFYRDLYTKAGIMDLDIQTWDDVEKVPIVDKDEYRRIPLEQRISEPYNPKKHYKHSTSGSSGNPLMIVYSKFVEYTGHVRVFYMLVRAAHYNPFQKIFMIARYEEDDKFAIEKDLSFIGKLQKWCHFFQREIVSIYRDPDYIINRILEEKPKIIWATPSVMEIVTNRLIVRDIKLNIP